MAVHINESVARAAAVAIRKILVRSGSPWLVWSVSDEGYSMAPASSREAANIRKYWPETIAGEFQHPVLRETLLSKLHNARARQAVSSDNRTDARRAYEAQYKARQRAKAAA
jgi:hypothetical protein